MRQINVIADTDNRAGIQHLTRYQALDHVPALSMLSDRARTTVALELANHIADQLGWPWNQIAGPDAPPRIPLNFGNREQVNALVVDAVDHATTLDMFTDQVRNVICNQLVDAYHGLADPGRPLRR